MTAKNSSLEVRAREVEWLRRLLLRYVEQEETAAPYSSSPLREESRRAIKETA